METLVILSIVFLLSLSVMLFDLDLIRAKKFGNVPPNEPSLPKWVAVVYWVCIGSWIAILFINWKIAILGVIVYYVSTFIPLPQMIGNMIMRPFKPKHNK